MTLYCSQTAGMKRGWREGNSCPASLPNPLHSASEFTHVASHTSLLQCQAGLDDLQFAVDVSCFVCHSDRKFFPHASLHSPLISTLFLAAGRWSNPTLPAVYVYLQRGELSLLGKESFLLFRRVGVVAVLVQPVPQDLNRLLRQVPAPLPFPVAPGAGRQVQRGIHAFLLIRFTPGQHHQTCTGEERA